MFFRIGEQDTDSVFRRSFSVLLLPLFLLDHRSQPFLSKAEILRVKENLLQNLNQEQDRRGFVNGKGWVHAIAHAADTLDALAQCGEITRHDLQEILAAIRAVISVRDIVYVYGEKDSASPTLEMIMLSVVFMAITLGVFACYGILSSSISAYLMNSSKALKRVHQGFAVILAGFAVQLALSEKQVVHSPASSA